MPDLETSTPAREGVFRGSRWLQVAVLLEGVELLDLLQTFSNLQVFVTSGVVGKGQEQVTAEDYCIRYENHLKAIQASQRVESSSLAISLSVCPSCLYVMSVGEQGRLVRVRRPVIEVRPHSLGYCKLDGKFRSMIRGESAIFWGIELSYPQLYQSPQSGEILATTDPAAFPNALIFRNIQRWMRQHTRPTPFIVEGRVLPISARLGRRCEWAYQHPQLLQQGIGLKR